MRVKALLFVTALTLLIALPAAAQSPTDQPAKLGGNVYNCMGAVIAGTASGVAKFTGKWLHHWPGLKSETGYTPGPYANEKPLFTITADNMSKYADKLTAGEQALLRKYPNEYRMNIYPSHRDFRVPDYVCKDAKINVQKAKLTHHGLALNYSNAAPPFPFPENGLQAIWDATSPVTPYSEQVTFDTADVFDNGDITWGRVFFMQMTPDHNPDAKKRAAAAGSNASAYFLHEQILPARDRGQTAVGRTPNGYANGNTTQAWVYQPGIRRIRKAPEVGFDYPVPPSGLRTSDSDYVFNGSPERYDWKLLGKQVMYVPYNNFRVNDPALSYDQLLGKHVLNPKYVRYELHRVWVIEGTLKPGMRHIYKRRVIYADEDSWLPLLGDNYDNHNQLYRVPIVFYHFSPKAGTYHRGVSVYHDLRLNAYEATYLVNERPHWWTLDRQMSKQEFTPSAAMRIAQ